MASSCPICDARSQRKAIEALAESGGDLASVKKLLADRGLKVSTYWIRKHFREHARTDPDKLHASVFVSAQSKRDKEVQAAAEVKRKEEVKEYLDDLATIDLDRVLATIGVGRNPSTMGDVLTLVQKVSLALHTAAGAVAFDRLERFMRDPEGRRYPQTELRGAKLTSEMVSEAFGTQQAASLQTAVDTLEKAGFRVVADDAATLPGDVAKAE